MKIGLVDHSGSGKQLTLYLCPETNQEMADMRRFIKHKEKPSSTDMPIRRPIMTEVISESDISGQWNISYHIKSIFVEV